MSSKLSQHRARRARHVLSATAAAAVSAIFARHAGAVTLNQYYYDVSIYSDAGLTNLVSSVVINQSNPAVNLPIGDYLSFGISDVLTNNPNPAAGDTSGIAPNNMPQPANLGIAEIGYDVLSSDTTGITLAPNLSAGIRGFLQPNGLPDYYSTAQILPTSLMPTHDPGDVEFASGDVGLNFQIFAGANPTVRSGAAKGVAILSIFTPNVGSTASFANSTPLFDSLSYQGVNDGTVNLAPQIVKGVDGTLLSYWTNSSIGSGTAVSTYTTSNFGAQASDSIVPLPTLAVNIVGTLPPPPTHPIIALTLASPGSNYAGSGLIPVTITDNEGVYTIKQMVLKTSRATNTFEVNGLIPSPQTEELFAFDMNLDSDQLATLAADINSTNAYGFGSAIASTSLANDPFSGLFNLFLTFSDSQLPPGTTGTDYLGFDFTQDPNVSGAEPFQVAVTAVPEPMTFGAFVLGTVGSLLLRRRSRASPISSPG